MKTLEGCYIGETNYTYIADLLTQFEHCVKALDDEDMELGVSHTADDQVELAYNDTCKCGQEFIIKWNFVTLWRHSFVSLYSKQYVTVTTLLVASPC